MTYFISLKALFFTALLASSVAIFGPAQSNDNKPQAEILHWWSSAAESAALDVFVDTFKARGGHYYNSSKDDQVSNREEAIERMGKGYPSTLTQWNAGADVFEFYEFGLVDAISGPSLITKLKKTLPESVLDAVTHQDNIVAMPVNIHSENWMWHSTELIQPGNEVFTKDWKKFVALGEVLAKNNIPLVAVGDQSWQVRILFTSIFLGISRDAYKDFYLSTDISAVDRPEFADALTAFSHLARYSKSFGDGNWNTQVRAVAENQAASTFMGDWAKGEFQFLGKLPGRDYGCSLTASDNPSLLLVIDSFILGKVTTEEEKRGQALMLDVVSDPEVNLQFNTLKGSVSPYKKPSADELDICNSQVYSILNNKDAVIPPYASIGARRPMHALDTQIYTLWKESQQTTDINALVSDTLEKFRKIMAEHEVPVASIDE